MHQAQHTFAMELRRVAGIDAPSHALGHADLNTTLGIYGHFDGTDLEGAMESSPSGSRRKARQSFPPKIERTAQHFRAFMETVGIEPTSAIA